MAGEHFWFTHRQSGELPSSITEIKTLAEIRGTRGFHVAYSETNADSDDMPYVESTADENRGGRRSDCVSTIVEDFAGEIMKSVRRCHKLADTKKVMKSDKKTAMNKQ